MRYYRCEYYSFGHTKYGPEFYYREINPRIQAVYQTTVQLYIPFNVAGDFRFNISISIKGVGTQTTMIEYFLDADTTAPLYISQPISSNYSQCRFLQELILQI